MSTNTSMISQVEWWNEFRHCLYSCDTRQKQMDILSQFEEHINQISLHDNTKLWEIIDRELSHVVSPYTKGDGYCIGPSGFHLILLKIILLFIRDVSLIFKEILTTPTKMIHFSSSIGYLLDSLESYPDILVLVRKLSFFKDHSQSIISSLSTLEDSSFYFAVIIDTLTFEHISCSIEQQYFPKNLAMIKHTISMKKFIHLSNHLSNITNDTFSSFIQPIISRLILRSPEIIIPTISHMFKSVQFTCDIAYNCLLSGQISVLSVLIGHISSMKEPLSLTSTAALNSILDRLTLNDTFMIQHVYDELFKLSFAKQYSLQSKIILATSIWTFSSKISKSIHHISTSQFISIIQKETNERLVSLLLGSILFLRSDEFVSSFAIANQRQLCIVLYATLENINVMDDDHKLDMLNRIIVIESPLHSFISKLVDQYSNSPQSEHLLLFCLISSVLYEWKILSKNDYPFSKLLDQLSILLIDEHKTRNWIQQSYQKMDRIYLRYYCNMISNITVPSLSESTFFTFIGSLLWLLVNSNQIENDIIISSITKCFQRYKISSQIIYHLYDIILKHTTLHSKQVIALTKSLISVMSITDIISTLLSSLIPLNIFPDGWNAWMKLTKYACKDETEFIKQHHKSISTTVISSCYDQERVKIASISCLKYLIHTWPSYFLSSLMPLIIDELGTIKNALNQVSKETFAIWNHRHDDSKKIKQSSQDIIDKIHNTIINPFHRITLLLESILDRPYHNISKVLRQWYPSLFGILIEVYSSNTFGIINNEKILECCCMITDAVYDNSGMRSIAIPLVRKIFHKVNDSEHLLTSLVSKDNQDDVLVPLIYLSQQIIKNVSEEIGKILLTCISHQIDLYTKIDGDISFRVFVACFILDYMLNYDHSIILNMLFTLIPKESNDHHSMESLFCTCSRLMVSADINILSLVLSLLDHTCIKPNNDILSAIIWSCQFHDDNSISELANSISPNIPSSLDAQYLTILFPLLEKSPDHLCMSICKAISILATDEYPQTCLGTLIQLFSSYNDLVKDAKLSPKHLKERMYSQLEQNYKPRLWISIILYHIATYIAKDEDRSEILQSIFVFLLDDGLYEVTESVLDQFFKTGMYLIDNYSHHSIESLMPLLDEQYKNQDSSVSVKQSDQMRQFVVIYIATLGQKLSTEQYPIKSLIDNHLITVLLNTPSEHVQYTVAQCLVPSFRLFSIEVLDPYYTKFFNILFPDGNNNEKYETQVGAAFGLASVIKASHLFMIQKYELITFIKTSQLKTSVLILIETMAKILQHAFEPYINSIFLPILIPSLGDSKETTRQAAKYAAKAIMTWSMSLYTVQSSLPTLLSMLSQENWRMKVGCLELLGSMAWMAPKQLASSVMTIIPRLLQDSDAHPQVQQATQRALQSFLHIENHCPETKALLLPLLLAWTGNIRSSNNNDISSIITTLYQTSFSHYIDVTSLSFLLPLLERGLREKSSEVKRKTCQIIGNICVLASCIPEEFFKPLLSLLSTQILFDPVPQTREMAAKTLGICLKRKKSSEDYESIVASLVHVLKTSIDSRDAVNRTGAAQGLVEIAFAGDNQKNDLELFIKLIHESPSTVSISLVLYLLKTFHILLSDAYLQRILDFLLDLCKQDIKSLKPNLDVIRQVFECLSTHFGLIGYVQIEIFDNGHRFHCTRKLENYDSMTLTIPVTQLVLKMFLNGLEASKDESMIKLFLEMIQMILEASNEIQDDRSVFLERYLSESYNHFISIIYYLRFCTLDIQIRQLALHIWKSIVDHPVKVLKSIIGKLLLFLIQKLNIDQLDWQIETAHSILDDLINRLEGSILGEFVSIIEHIEDNIYGIFIALLHVFDTMKKESEMNIELNEYTRNAYIQLIRNGLTINDESVRFLSAKFYTDNSSYIEVSDDNDTLFDSLFKELADKDNGDELFEALLVLWAAGDCDKQILDRLINHINDTLFHLDPAIIANRLSRLIQECPEDYLDMYTIMPIILGCTGLDDKDQVSAIFLDSISYFNDQRIELIDLLLENLSINKIEHRRGAMILFSCLLEHDQCKFMSKNQWMKLVKWLKDSSDSNSRLLDAFTTFAKANLTKDLLEIITQNGDQSSNSMVFLSIYIHGLTALSGDDRMNCIRIILDSISYFTGDSSQWMALMGALIRVFSEPYDQESSKLKQMIIKLILICLKKKDTVLKPFMPQLSRCLLKGLTDSTLSKDCASGLSTWIIPMTPKIDMVLGELLLTLHHCISTNDLDINVILEVCVLAAEKQNGIKTSFITEESKNAWKDVLSKLDSDNSRHEMINRITKLLDI